MKTFITMLLLGLVSVAASAEIIARDAPGWLPPPESLGAAFEARAEAAADLEPAGLVVGSSVVECGIDSEPIADAVDQVVYNHAFGGGRLDLLAAWLASDRVPESTRWVLVGVRPAEVHGLWTKTTGVDAFGQAPVGKLQRLADRYSEAWHRRDAFTRPFRLLLHHLEDKVELLAPEELGIDDLGNHECGIDIPGALAKGYWEGQADPTRLARRALASIRDTAIDRGWGLVLVTMPARQAATDAIVAQDPVGATNDLLAAHAAEAGGCFLDLSEGVDDKAFYDPIHMHLEGRTAFSAALVQALTSEPACLAAIGASTTSDDA